MHEDGDPIDHALSRSELEHEQGQLEDAQAKRTEVARYGETNSA